MQLTNDQFALIKQQFATLKERSAFYAAKFDGIDLSDVQTQEDFEKLPFSEKDDLRNAYPLGLQAVPDEEVVRIHSSSGTTGTPVIVPYTQQDVTDWAVQFARCYETAGITNRDRIHITPGYGLWTAGIGFQLGAERLGAMTIPMGPGNTEKQLRMMQDLKSTVLCATSSYALLLAEEIAERGGGRAPRAGRRGRRGAFAVGLEAQRGQILLHFAFAFQEELRLRGVEVAHQRDELAHVGLLLVADVGQHGLGGRVVGCLIVGVVQEDGFKLARDVDAERLHEFGVRHLAVNVACKRIGETGHTIPLFRVRGADGIGGGSGLLSARYDTPFIMVAV